MKRSLYLALIILTMTMASCDEGQDTHPLPEDAISIGLSLKPAFDVGLNIDLVQAIIEKGPFKDTLDLAITGDSASGVFTNLARGTYSVEVNMFEDTALVASGSGTAIVRAGRTTVIEITLVFRKGSLVILATWGVPIDSSLVAYYPFNNNANDESFYGHHGSVSGAIPTQDRFGNANSAYFFDGINDFISASESAVLDLSTVRQLTISCWIRKDSSLLSGPAIISKWGASADSDDEWLIWFPNDTLTIQLNPSTTFGSTDLQFRDSSDIPLNQWRHIVFVWNGSGITGKASYYADGVLYRTDTSTVTTIPNTSEPIRIGTFAGAGINYFHGSIDDIRIYRRELSETEIIALYHEGGW